MTRRRWGAIVVALAALAVAVWHLAGTAPADPEIAGIAPAATQAPTTDTHPAGNAPERPAAASVPAAASASAHGGAEPDEGSKALAVCGRPPLALGTPGSQAEAETAALVQREKDRWSERLAAAGSDRARAAAALMSHQRDRLTMLAPPDDLFTHCVRNDRDCRAKAVGTWAADQARDAQRRLEPLVDRALQSSDVAIYALAAQACAAGPLMDLVVVPARCAQLSHAEWARRDPGNAEVWLAMAAQAQNAGDPVAQLRALQQAAAAPRRENYFGVVVEALSAARPDDLHPVAEFQVATEVLGNHFGIGTLVGMSTVLGACRTEELGLPGRRHLCEGLAMGLGDPLARDALDPAMAWRLGERLGWSADRVAALRDEARILAEVSGSRMPADEARLGCERLQVLRRYQADWSRGGELVAMRAGFDATSEDELRRLPGGLAERALALRRARQAAAPPGR